MESRKCMAGEFDIAKKEDDFGHELRVGRVLRSYLSAAIQMIVLFFVRREIEIGGAEGTPFFQKFIFSHAHFFTVQGLEHFLEDISSDDNSWSSSFAAANLSVYDHLNSHLDLL
jgi:hypothetical protein